MSQEDMIKFEDMIINILATMPDEYFTINNIKMALKEAEYQVLLQEVCNENV